MIVVAAVVGSAVSVVVIAAVVGSAVSVVVIAAVVGSVVIAALQVSVKEGLFKEFHTFC